MIAFTLQTVALILIAYAAGVLVAALLRRAFVTERPAAVAAQQNDSMWIPKSAVPVPSAAPAARAPTTTAGKAEARRFERALTGGAPVAVQPTAVATPGPAATAAPAAKPADEVRFPKPAPSAPAPSAASQPSAASLAVAGAVAAAAGGAAAKAAAPAAAPPAAAPVAHPVLPAATGSSSPAMVSAPLARPVPPPAQVPVVPPAATPPAAADDLTRIKGIDQALAARLVAGGVRYYQQIAEWQPADVHRVGDALGLKGRIQQENWIEQAQILAKGGSTAYVAEQARTGVATAAPKPEAGESRVLRLPPAVVAAAAAASAAARLAEHQAAQSALPEAVPVPPTASRIATSVDASTATQTASAVPAVTVTFGAPPPVAAPPASPPAQPVQAAAENVAAAAVMASPSAASAQAAATPTPPSAPAPSASPAAVKATQAALPAPSADPPSEPARAERLAVEIAEGGVTGQTLGGLSGQRSVRSETYRGSDPAETVRRPGAGDDLKRIRGIGVLIERRLNAMGVTGYGQIAGWSTADIDKVSQVLDFKGRIERENWVEQARILVSGGQTEFSRRVDRGDAEAIGSSGHRASVSITTNRGAAPIDQLSSRSAGPDVGPIEAGYARTPRLPTPPIVEDLVQCSAYAPDVIDPRFEFSIQGWLHVIEDAERVRSLAKELEATAGHRGYATLMRKIARGTSVSITVTSKDLDIDEPSQTIVWHGEGPQYATFLASVNENAHKKPAVYVAMQVSVDGVPYGSIKFPVALRWPAADMSNASFTLMPSSEAPPSQDGSMLRPQGRESREYRHVFVSYCSRNRNDVVRIMQGIRVGRPEWTYFWDIDTLQPSQNWRTQICQHIRNCDLFVLVWSQAACASEEVANELDYALFVQEASAARYPDIAALPIEGPPFPDPPGQLRHLHFADRFQFYYSTEAV